jgi:hypothetical protein
MMKYPNGAAIEIFLDFYKKIIYYGRIKIGVKGTVSVKLHLKSKIERRMRFLGMNMPGLTAAYNQATGEHIGPYRMRQICRATRPAIKQLVVLTRILQVDSGYWRLGKALTAMVDAKLEMKEVAKRMGKSISNTSFIINRIDKKKGFGLSTKTLYKFAAVTGKPLDWFFEY